MSHSTLLEGKTLLEQVQKERPLIHCITNYVTANDVANCILGVGASPVMADGIREVEDITRASRALVLNLGTLQEAALPSMLAAGKLAAHLGHPVVYDPVGAGASGYRTEAAMQIIRQVPSTVIRGNASEIRTLAHGLDIFTNKQEPVAVRSHGVDADERETVSEENLDDTIAMLGDLSHKTGAILVMTGGMDLVVQGEQHCQIKNGHPMMARITGTGCMLDGVLAAFLAVSPVEERFMRTAYAVAAHGICGEFAYERMAAADGGTGSFRQYFLDAMSRLEDEVIWRKVRYEF